MPTFFVYCLNCFYIPCFFVATLLFGLFCPLVFLVVKLKTGVQKDEIIRKLIHYYGSFLLFIAWPLIRVKRRGVNNLPKKSPCVVIVNHRSTVDMFFGSLFTPFNTTVFVRSWPFKIPGFKKGYVLISEIGILAYLSGNDVFIADRLGLIQPGELAKRANSFLKIFYPKNVLRTIEDDLKEVNSAHLPVYSVWGTNNPPEKSGVFLQKDSLLIQKTHYK